MSEETTTSNRRIMSLTLAVGGAILVVHVIIMQLFPAPWDYGTVVYLGAKLFSIPYIVFMGIVTVVFGIALLLYVRGRGYTVLGIMLFIAGPVTCAGTFLPAINFEHIDSARLGGSVYHIGCSRSGAITLDSGEQAHCNLYKCDPLGAVCSTVHKNFGPPSNLDSNDTLFLVTERDIVQVAFRDKRRIILTYTP